jgi:hypothetical protein
VTTVQEHTLDLARGDGHGLVATVRMLRPTITDSSMVRFRSLRNPRASFGYRLWVLREIHDRITLTGAEDNDPLSVGHGNIGRVLDWVDQLNGEGEEGGTLP